MRRRKIKWENPEVRHEYAIKLRENLNQFKMDEFKKINKENAKVVMAKIYNDHIMTNTMKPIILNRKKNLSKENLCGTWNFKILGMK